MDEFLNRNSAGKHFIEQVEDLLKTSSSKRLRSWCGCMGLKTIGRLLRLKTLVVDFALWELIMSILKNQTKTVTLAN